MTRELHGALLLIFLNRACVRQLRFLVTTAVTVAYLQEE